MRLNLMSIDAKYREKLRSVYAEVMWLSSRPNVTPSRARSWYTHVMAVSLAPKLRCFTGMVSSTAVHGKNQPLVLEHYKQMQAILTALVDRHCKAGLKDCDEFIRTVADCEQVHIVTRSENYAARRARGDYRQAGIILIPWKDLPEPRRIELWRQKLYRKVANAGSFAP